jgi:hypothetical protein
VKANITTLVEAAYLLEIGASEFERHTSVYLPLIDILPYKYMKRSLRAIFEEYRRVHQERDVPTEMAKDYISKVRGMLEDKGFERKSSEVVDKSILIRKDV